VFVFGWFGRLRLGLSLGSALLTASLGAQALEPEAPRLLFRFSASSTLFAAPGVGHDGSLYVGSGDGYVHALAPDGTYRWSYTLRGRVVAAPVEEGSTGRVFVVTSDARLYALEPDAHLRWVFPLPAAPKTELLLTPKGTLLFVGRDDHLYGVTTSGALVLRLAAPGARSAPALLSSGQTALILNDTVATLKGYGFERTPLAGSWGASAKLLLDADRAIFACDDGKARVLSGARVDFEQLSDCLSPPTRGDGFFALAEASGSVRLFYADGAHSSLPVGTSALRPVWDAPRRRLIVSSGAGNVSVLEVPPVVSPR
jgi:hypothetical protein